MNNVCTVEDKANTAPIVNPGGDSEFIIQVNRFIEPKYPDFKKKIINPELNLGASKPLKYDLLLVRQQLHDDILSDKNRGSKKYWGIYKKLYKEDKSLESCLDWHDGLAIQKKGTLIFRKIFGVGKYVLLWGSVIEDGDEDKYVPYLKEHDGQIIMSWMWLGEELGRGNITLRFPCQS